LRAPALEHETPFSNTMNHNLLLRIAIGVLLASSALANVRIVHRSQITGLTGVGDFDTKITEHYNGTMRRSETVTNVSGGVVGFLSKKDQTETAITRLDKGVIWTLEPDDKEYKEQSFDEMAKQLRKAQDGNDGERKNDDVHYRYDVKVETPSDRLTIAGYDAAHTRILVTVIEENTKEKTSKESSYLTYDLWLADGGKNVQQEVTTFSKAYMERLGLTGDAPPNPMIAKSMAQFAGMMKEATTKIKATDGLPVKTIMLIETPGGADHEAKSREDQGPPMSIGSAIGSMFGGGSSEKAAAPKTEGTPGRRVAMKITDEVLEVGTAPISADLFEIPAGWSKD
jgi:hypothetical protein